MENNVSTRFVDPRNRPEPPWTGVARAPVEDAADVAPLIEAVIRGCLYDVERWISGGGPIQFTFTSDSKRVQQSPIQAAIRSGQHDVVLLLLCNGYRTELEEISPLTEALQERRRDIVELLLAWGVDPNGVCVGEVVSCYDRELVEEFWRRGVDLSEGDALAEQLSYATRNKPLYGFLKRHAPEDPRLQAALDRGLCMAIDNEQRHGEHAKAVSLCVWAGANPWTPVPEWHDDDEPETEEDRELRIDYRCAAGRAVSRQRSQLLRLMKIRPDTDRFQRLFPLLWDAETYDVLVRVQRPRDPSAITNLALCRIGCGLSEYVYPSLRLLERVLETGGRIDQIDDAACTGAQRYLRGAGPDSGRSLLRLLQDPELCDESVLLRILHSPKIIEQSGEMRVAKSNLEKLLALPTTSTSVAAAVRRQLRGRTRR